MNQLITNAEENNKNRNLPQERSIDFLIDYTKLLSIKSEKSSASSLSNGDFQRSNRSPLSQRGGEEPVDPTPRLFDMKSFLNVSSQDEKNPFINKKKNELEMSFDHERSSLFLQRKQSTQKLKILIADDNVFNIFILENYLKKISGYRIELIRAFTGEEALRCFQNYNAAADKSENIIDIIFMDCEMPVMDGYTATRKIRDLIQREKYKNCLIAACTSYQGKEEEEKCLACGMDVFLVKPVSQEEVFNLMEGLNKSE